MDTKIIVIGIFIVIAIYITLWCFIRPVKLVVKLGVKSVIGYAALLICNQLFGGLGFAVGLNAFTTIICGVFGIHGFLLLTGLNFLIR